MAKPVTRETKAATSKGAPAAKTPKAQQSEQQSKSMKMGTDELKDLIKSAVKEAMGGDGDELTGDAPLEGVTTGDVMSIIEQAVQAVDEKHKSRKEAGEEDVGEITAEEVLQEAAAMLDELAATSDEGMSDDPDDECKEGEEEPEEKEDGADDEAKRRKSAPARKRQTKAAARPAPTQRKYADVFLNGGARNGARKQQKTIPPMVQLARAIKCLDVFGRNDPERAAFYARKHYDDAAMEREFKALSATNPVNGGFLIPEVYTDDIIELLYNKTVIKELGARTIPLETGNLNIPRMTSGTRARWGGEARKIGTTQPSFGNLRLSAHRLEAIVPQTRELIMSTKYSADEMFAADLSRRMQLGLDWGGLYGTGGEFQPTGIANTKGIEIVDAKKMDAQYADATGKVTADFPVYIKALVMSKNVDDQALGWAFNSFMEAYLMNLKTTTGDYLYREEMNGGKFLGIPYAVTNQIPWTKEGLTDIFFGNWADMLIGDQMGLETFTTLEGSWTDEDGVQHNAFEENLTGTRALMYDDIGVRHVESFVHVKNVKAF